MRNVYPTDQVIHIWAHQGQESARNGSNVRFNGKLLYSYSTVIAQLETAPDGSQWAFLSSESLTPTTGNHVSRSRSATRHLNQFYTSAFSSWSGYGRNFKELIEPAAAAAMRELENKLSGKHIKRTKENAILHYINERARIMPVAQLFNVAITMPDIQAGPEAVAEYQERKAAEQAAAELIRLKAQKKQQKEDKKTFQVWLTTGAGRCPYSFQERGNDFITIKNYDKSAAATTRYVVTSQGAECPLDHVVKALRFWEGKKIYGDSGLVFSFEPYHTNGHKIPLGHFTLDSIDEAGTVKAGCHTFSAKEIQRFINQWKEVLGL